MLLEHLLKDFLSRVISIGSLGVSFHLLLHLLGGITDGGMGNENQNETNLKHFENFPALVRLLLRIREVLLEDKELIFNQAIKFIDSDTCIKNSLNPEKGENELEKNFVFPINIGI